MAVSALMLAASAGLAGPFTPGNLVVTQIYDGSGTVASGAAAPILLVEIDIHSGAVVQTIALPTTGSGSNHAITTRGNSTSSSHLRRSLDGRYLTVLGYDAPVGTANVNQTSALTNPRVVARIDDQGNVDTSTALTDAFEGRSMPTSFTADPREAVSLDGSQFWMSASGGLGSTGGVRYTTFGSTTSTQISASPGNSRCIDIFNNQLYVTAASTSGGNFIGVISIGMGVPTTGGQTASQLLGFPLGAGSASPYEIFFSDASTVYVADDGSLNPTPPVLPGGVQKWTFDAGSGLWSLQYTMQTGLTSGCRGLTGKVDRNGVTLWATSADAVSKIVTTVDTGAGSAFTVLATAPTTTPPASQVLYRGIDFVPVSTNPPPSCYANCDGSTSIPFLNVNDFICFQSQFASGSSYANCDGSTTIPVLNVNDFICFQSRFAAGCSAP